MVLTKRLLSYSAIIALGLWIALPAIAGAAVVSDGSLLLSDPRPDQTNVSYTLSGSGFTTGTSIGCIQVELNTEADGSGTVPSGVDTQSSTLASSTLITTGSWSVDNTTNGTLRVTNSTGENPASSGDVVWSAVENGDTADTTYFAILDTYESDDCTTGPVDSTVVTFVYVDGSLVELVIEPTLTFAVNGVTTGEGVNGATTSQGTSATAINFGNQVTATTNGVSAHDLQVSTNAPGGYSVYIRHTGDLTNGSHTIDNHAGTNATPTSFASPGTEGWGYTSSDLFGSNLWAGFTTNNEIVMENTAATTGTETNRVGHQVGIEATTPAGTYQTTVVYTVASTY